MANEILMMKVRQCVKDLSTLKHVFSKSEENENKYAEIKLLVIDVLEELASEVPDKSKVDTACKNLKDIAQEYNDAGDNLDVKKAAGSFAAKVALLKARDYSEFLAAVIQEDKNDTINYLLKEEEPAEMSANELEREAFNAYYAKDFDKSLEYAKKALEKGSILAYCILGFLYEENAWNKSDLKKSYQYYLEGARKEEPGCQYQVYLHLVNGIGVLQNANEAYKWLEKSANHEYPLAMTALAKFFCHKTMAKYHDAFQLFKKAADKGDEEAKAWVGRCYEYGYGVLRDVNQAKSIYQQEMNRGNEYAKDFYNQLLNEERKIAEVKRKREEEKRQKEEEKQKKTRNFFIFLLLLVGILWAGYEFWFKDYKRDKDAPRSYVYATNLFLRSSKEAESEYNRIGKIPYGSELITYSNMNGWAEVKFNGEKGYVSSDFLLGYNDFQLLNGIWGNEDAKEIVATSKCRMAILDLLKKYSWESGPDAWQIFTKAKEMKPNSVLYPSLNDGYDDFSEFAFILLNNRSKKRKFVLYSFKKDETPVFRYMEDAPDKDDIKSVTYNKRNNKYRVTYSGQGNVYTPKEETQVKTKTEKQNDIKSLEITDISFANVDYDNKVIATYGAHLYQDTKYLKAKVAFKKSSDVTQTFKFQIKIYKADGSITRSNSSPSGCTFEEEVKLIGKSGHFFTSGWGSNNGTLYTPGVYRYEIWCNGKKLYSKNIEIKSRTMVKTDSKPSTDTTDNTVFISVEQMPEFPGGKNAMMEYIQKKLVYPSAAVQNGVQGRVVVSFIIEKDGSISNTTVLKGVDSHLDKEALRIIKSMPKWKPAMQSGKYVRYKYTFPITFKLRK